MTTPETPGASSEPTPSTPPQQPTYQPPAGYPQQPGAGSQPPPGASYQQPPVAAYGAPVQALPPQPPAPKAKRPLNVIGLISLIAAGLGFIFACIPGALIVGWILLPIGFVLGIVSLFLKDRGKALGLAGLIVSIVGTIVAFVVFFAVVASSFSDAFSDETVIATEPSSEAQTNTETETTDEEPAAEPGTRENPLPLGTAVSSDTWTAVVNGINADGNATVAEANQFNTPPPAGSHYEIVNYTVTYTGAESAYSAEVMVDLVTAAGNVIQSYDNPVVLNDTIGLDELFNGASTTGSAAFLVPDGESVLIRVQPGFLADEVFYTP